ncbi:MAG TPA: DUF4272 domain-containing protein, partial [Flavobacteriales bacterium]|nr:DUF4272 domain-containing protein [Flavobacteriales bacterium]
MITLYSHNIGFEKITEILKKELPNATITTEKQEGSDVVHVELKGSLFKPGKKFRINYRQREQPSFELPMETTCPVATNLKGMLGFVSRFKATNEKVKDLLLHKIQTLNCEFSVLPEKGEVPEMKRLVQTIATNFDAVLFAQPDTIFSKADGYHFLDKELKLILDAAGNTEVNDLTVTIDPLYFDVAQDNLKPDQTERKKSTEEMLEANGVPFAKTLPCIVSEAECKLRSPKEIAQRAMVMSLTNLVAFGHVEGQEGIEFLQKRGLW